MSIPIFTAQLRKARVATDLANERAAKAAAVAATLAAESISSAAAVEHVYVYDAASGTVKASTEATNITPYGKVSDPNKGGSNDGFADTSTVTHVGKIVQVTIGTDNEIKINWIAGKTA